MKSSDMPIQILTKDNHFKFGYDYDWYRCRLHKTERFTVAFAATARPIQDWPSECVATAGAIKDTAADMPIELLFSGGINSEVVVRSFVAAGIPFTAHILRFGDEINAHDIVHNIQFCKAHGVCYKMHDLNILQFFEADLYDYAAVSQCVSPQVCVMMWLIDQLDGYVVMGSKPNLVRRPSGRWALRESETANALYRYCLATDRPGVPGFHQYTPELMLSYLLDSISHLRSDESCKNQIELYTRFLERHSRYTGYELVMNQYEMHQAQLMLRYPQHDDACHMDVAFILDHLRGTLNHSGR
jgi:hypothetical protein